MEDMLDARDASRAKRRGRYPHGSKSRIGEHGHRYVLSKRLEKMPIVGTV